MCMVNEDSAGETESLEHCFLETAVFLRDFSAVVIQSVSAKNVVMYEKWRSDEKAKRILDL